MVAILLYAASSIKFFDRDPLSQQVGPQGPIQLFVLAIVTLTLIVTVRRYSQRVIAPSSAKAFLVFGAIAIVSSVFSFYPLLSLAKGLAFLLVCGIAVLACSAFRPAQVLKYLYYAFTTILATELVVKFAGGWPLLDVDDYSGRSKLSLFGLHPTLLGELSSITLLLGFLLSKRPPVYCQGFLLVMAVLSGSRTGSTLLLVVILAAWLASVRLNSRLVSLYCGLACGLMLVLIGSQMNDHLSADIAAITRPLYGDTLSRDVSTLDGRTDVWDAATPALARSVILGYGLGGARDVLVNNSSKYWVAGDAHNAFVELTLGGGFLAVLIFLLGWAGAARLAWRSRGSLRIGTLAVYAYIAGFGIVAPDLTNLQALATFLIITVDMMVSEEFTVSRSQVLRANIAVASEEPLENPACT
jgi:exopolysaccharide production protein ExoQ